MVKNTTAPKTEQAKKTESENTTAQLSRELKAEIDKLPGESFEDRIRGLMSRAASSDAEASEEKGMVVLKMPEKAFEQLIVWQPSTVFRDMLIKSRV